jgi:hypothetical protein
MPRPSNKVFQRTVLASLRSARPAAEHRVRLRRKMRLCSRQRSRRIQQKSPFPKRALSSDMLRVLVASQSNKAFHATPPPRFAGGGSLATLGARERRR